MRKRMLVLLTTFVIVLSLCSTGRSETLTTLFTSDNGSAGNTFDLVATNPLTINSFDVNINSPAGSTDSVAVYYRLGTAVGNESNEAAWTLLGTDTNVTSQGDDAPTPVNIGGLSLTPGQVYGIYISLLSYYNHAPNHFMRYTDGGPTDYNDGNLTLTTNTGERFPAFSSNTYPRQWNGNIHYSLDAIPTLSEWGFIVLMILLAFLSIKMVRNANTVA